MDFQDKTLTCKDCSKEFTWSAGEQKFYQDKGLQNSPSRCPDCRKQMKEKKTNRQMYPITCKECGKAGEVPFEPRDPKDVLCAECFTKNKTAGGTPESKSDAEPAKTEEPEQTTDANI